MTIFRAGSLPNVPKALSTTEVDSRIDQWHTSDEDVALHFYLGWSMEEYWHWVMTDELPVG